MLTSIQTLLVWCKKLHFLPVTKLKQLNYNKLIKQMQKIIKTKTKNLSGYLAVDLRSMIRKEEYGFMVIC